VAVVNVVAVLVIVRDRVVLVRVAVGAGGHRMVHVRVVPIVVGVHVLVHQALVGVAVAVALGSVQRHARQDQRRRRRELPSRPR
jgi:hypothetical protein